MFSPPCPPLRAIFFQGHSKYFRSYLQEAPPHVNGKKRGNFRPQTILLTETLGKESSPGPSPVFRLEGPGSTFVQTSPRIPRFQSPAKNGLRKPLCAPGQRMSKAREIFPGPGPYLPVFCAQDLAPHRGPGEGRSQSFPSVGSTVSGWKKLPYSTNLIPIRRTSSEYSEPLQNSTYLLEILRYYLALI